MQNQTKATSQCFVADEGKVLINIDQSGAEALIVAYEADMGAFRGLFQAGIKSHVFVALHVFADVWRAQFPDADLDALLEANPAQLKAHKDFARVETAIKDSDFNPPSTRYYHIAKMACHALNYGMMPPTFQQNVLVKSEGQIALPMPEAQRIYDVYHALFPEIKRWHQRVTQTLSSTRTLHNLFGHPSRFTDRWSPDLVREALSFTPQSTVGMITNKVFVKTQNYIEENDKDWDLLNNKHDSVLLQCPEADTKECVALLRSYMNMPLISTRGEQFSMKSGVEVGKRWTPYKEGKQEDGMKGWED